MRGVHFKMSYSVKHTDTNVLPIEVNETTVDNSTDLNLLGRVKLEYGEELNENLLHILENLACPANSSSPDTPDYSVAVGTVLENPIDGQLWYNKTNQNIYVYDKVGTEWVRIGSDSGIGANFGQVYDGGRLPLPVTTGALSYSNCIMTVSPAITASKYDYMVCTVDENGYVTMRYRPVGSTEIVAGVANYLILGISGHTNNGTYQDAPVPNDVTPTPTVTPTVSTTPSPTPTVTPSTTPSAGVTPTPTPTVTPSTTPSYNPSGDVIDQLHLSASSTNENTASVTLKSNGTFVESWYPSQQDTGNFIVNGTTVGSSYTFTVVPLNGTTCGPTSGNFGTDKTWTVTGGVGTCSIRVDITAPSGDLSGQIFIDVYSGPASSGGGGGGGGTIQPPPGTIEK